MESSAEISFFQAKNGSQVCSCKNINLHSAYNPEKEGDRFAETIAESFFPSAILVTEPALSYCKEGLHKKYPDAKLTCIRYSKKFSSTDKEWNKVFYFSNETELENELFDFFGEEGILSCIFLSWQPSANVFPETNQKAWSAIKNAVTKSTAVLSTRKYFAGRWLKNSVIFFSRVENISVIKKGSSPVIIAASGRSLNSSLPFLKKNRSKFFLIAVSSAIQPLLFNGITPDLCLSTDGGFWAKKHLEILLKPEHADIPLALTSEANCPSKILTSAPIIPLSYYDFPETDFFENLGIPSLHAYRNGTVSGTAALLAMEITSSHIYFCGLDMSENPGFQHCQPNSLEICTSLQDFRLMPKSTRIAKTSLPSESMEIYRNWFSSQNDFFSQRISRIADFSNFRFSNTLGKIKDVDWRDFSCEDNLILPKIEKMHNFSPKEKAIHRKKICQRLETLEKSVQWLKNAFPADFLNYSRTADTNKKNKLMSVLQQKNENLLKDLKRLTNV